MKEKETVISNYYYDVVITKAENGFSTKQTMEIYHHLHDPCVKEVVTVFEEKEDPNDTSLGEHTNAFKELVYHLAEYYGIVNTPLSDIFKVEE